MAKSVSMIIAATAAAMLFTTVAFCGDARKYWEFSRPIRLLDASKKAAAVPLDGRVYDAARADLRDLRVIDNRGNDCPYAVFTQPGSKTEKEIKTTVFSKLVSATESMMIVELGAQAESFNSVMVVPERKNFVRKITIEGSDDGAVWETIRKDIPIYAFSFEMQESYLARFTNEVYIGYGFGRYSEENLSVLVPEARFRMVRVRVPHDQNKEPVAISGIKLFRTAAIAAEEDSFRGRAAKTEADPESKSIETICDFGRKNLPLSRIEIGTDQTNFFRRAEVYAGNDMKTWQRAGEGVIFSVELDNEAEKNMTLRFGEARARHLKIKVFNGDNKPVRITQAVGYGIKRFLVMIPESGATYNLIYGHPAAPAVTYDTAQLVRGKTLDSFGKAVLGAEARNDKFEPWKEKKPWTEDKPYILWAAMAVIIAGIIFLGAQVIRTVDKK